GGDRRDADAREAEVRGTRRRAHAAAAGARVRTEALQHGEGKDPRRAVPHGRPPCAPARGRAARPRPPRGRAAARARPQGQLAGRLGRHLRQQQLGHPGGRQVREGGGAPLGGLRAGAPRALRDARRHGPGRA
ncbi:unnamed protein product, partial [Prorocentrum cordatum]